jgi:hypothetical protein
MGFAPDGRVVFVWRGEGDTNRLGEAIADHAVAELFLLEGDVLVQLDPAGGRPTSIGRNTLHEFVARHVVTVQIGSEGRVEYQPFTFPQRADLSREPDQKVLTDLMTILPRLCAKGPTVPSMLTPKQKDEVRMRLRQGEPKDRIADYYRVDIDEIAQLGSGR